LKRSNKITPMSKIFRSFPYDLRSQPPLAESKNTQFKLFFVDIFYSIFVILFGVLVLFNNPVIIMLEHPNYV